MFNVLWLTPNFLILTEALGITVPLNSYSVSHTAAPYESPGVLMPEYEEVTNTSERKPTNEEKDSLISNRYCSSGPQSPENDHEYTTVSLLYI